MTKLAYNGINEGNLRGKEETHLFLGSKPTKEPIIMEETKTVNVRYIESAKQAYKKKRGNIYPICGLLLAFVFVVWLIGLTIVREFQLADLKREVKELRESVEKIKTRYEDDQLLDELKDFEEEVKARESSVVEDSFIPRIADKDLFSVDDLKDEEDQDYVYLDEDQEAEEDIDRADFLGEVMEANRPPDISDQSDKEYEMKAERNRRSYLDDRSAEIQAVAVRNHTNTRYHKDHLMHKRIINANEISLDKRLRHNTATPVPEYFMTTRSAQTSENSKEYDVANLRRSPLGRNQASREQNYGEGWTSRMLNQREMAFKEENAPTESNFVVAQFHGDVSKQMNGEKRNANGHLLHSHDAPFTAWAPAPWHSHYGMDAYFQLQNGAVTIKESGIYFIYAQVYYHDKHDNSSYKVFRNSDGHKDELLHCVTMTYSKEPVDKVNTCYTAGMFHLASGNTICLKNVGDRNTMMRHGKSFFGLIKLGAGLGR